MELNKIIYDIREGLKQYSDDSELDNRYIEYLIDVKRAKYLRQELNNTQKTTDSNTIQTLTVSLEEVSVEECPVNLTCNKILKTCKKLPDPLQLHTKDGIIRIASLDRMSKPFNYITRDRAVYAGNSRYSNGIYSFLHDDSYLYIFSNNPAVNLIECISITGVWETPTDLSRFYTCCSCKESKPCFTEKSNYPIQPHLVDIIRKEIISELANLLPIPEDKSNDSNDQRKA